ncbi:uncharacterized protein LOC131215628 [Anopheles bellator]|uniref:uncharacterized protein LOC131215628 n=1 Tax=Anopheles bellator TaxID=139047 RepID=UPI002648C2FF|nr:uncharacterized protein LOC131215628 [Anopheles bellator]
MGDPDPEQPIEIKTEPGESENDAESVLPTLEIGSLRQLLDREVEVIDLTEDDYLKEFQTFLSTLAERRSDIEARSATTKLKSKKVRYVLGVAVEYLEEICFHQDSSICELFDLQFKNLLMYGRLVEQIQKEDMTIYSLDDGTGRVAVYYKHTHEKEKGILSKLDYLEHVLRDANQPLNDEGVPESVELRNHLKTIIEMTKANCLRRMNHPALETRCFVLGVPFIRHDDTVAIYAFSLLPELERGKSSELFWKSYLISFYEPYFTDEENETCSDESATEAEEVNEGEAVSEAVEVSETENLSHAVVSESTEVGEAERVSEMVEVSEAAAGNAVEVSDATEPNEVI